MRFQALRGFRDYLPADAAARRALFATALRVARLHGFEEVDTPSVESLELFKAKSGEGIVGETFSFQDKGGREVTLVPENTPSVARLYSERAKIEPLPVKWAAVSRLWRYEEPQAGRLREFSQVSLDVLGVPGVEGELELLATTRAILDALGLAGRYIFRVSDRRLTDALGHALGVAETAPFFRALDRREKLPPSEFQAELARAGVGPEGRARLGELLGRVGRGVPPVEAAPLLQELEGWPGFGEEGRKGTERMGALFAGAAAAGIADIVLFDPSLVRGIAYYTSTVFEAWARQGQIRALFGGGRYDRLIELFGGGNVPACGLAMGDQTLELLLREAGLWPERPPGLDVYVARTEAALAGAATGWVRDLRGAGYAADQDLLGRALSRQMKEAGRRGAHWLLLLGPREAGRGEVTLRNMRTGRQDVVAASALLARLKELGDGAPGPGPDPAPGA